MKRNPVLPFSHTFSLNTTFCLCNAASWVVEWWRIFLPSPAYKVESSSFVHLFLNLYYLTRIKLPLQKLNSYCCTYSLRVPSREPGDYPGHELAIRVVIKKIHTACNKPMSTNYLIFRHTLLLRKLVSEIIVSVMSFWVWPVFSFNKITKNIPFFCACFKNRYLLCFYSFSEF